MSFFVVPNVKIESWPKKEIKMATTANGETFPIIFLYSKRATFICICVESTLLNILFDLKFFVFAYAI